MRLKDKIEGKIGDGIFIELDDEYIDLDFYRKKESDYNYIKRKYAKNCSARGKYVSLYRDDYAEKLGYFCLCYYMSVKPIYKYSSYTRYAELSEFGFVNNNLNEIRFLVDYLIEYAAARGSYFIRVSTREKSFSKFYEFLRTYKHSEDDKYIYLEFEPVDYDYTRHLVKYKGDKVSVKELYHLQTIGFDIEKDICKFVLCDKDCFTVDRKTRKITYPERMINVAPKYMTLNQDSLRIMHVIISDDYSFAHKTVDLGYKIKGFDYEFIKIGDKLLAFDSIMYDEDGNRKEDFQSFARTAYKEYGYTSITLFGKATFNFKIFHDGFSTTWIHLPKYAGEEPEPSMLTRLRRMLSDDTK